ncbi:MAG: histone acetyltransferase [Firmicutes bacterium HGW-Firmicutes-1]|jgi:ribosomal protein S18 acetylase RimI-like enzyme|nr:MAG: histone acetyltransferase [Firmicutes bacterium HGW-Firmicutes-1]
MNELIEIHPMQVEDAISVQKLIKVVFDCFVGPDYSVEGVQTFYGFIHPDNIIDRFLNKQHKIFIAKDKDEIVGVIETRDTSHICLLFVHKQYQRKGIAKRLFNKAFLDSTLELTVNASPYAVTIYEKLGFTKIAGELIKNGITYIPMIKEK